MTLTEVCVSNFFFFFQFRAVDLEEGVGPWFEEKSPTSSTPHKRVRVLSKLLPVPSDGDRESEGIRPASIGTGRNAATRGSSGAEMYCTDSRIPWNDGNLALFSSNTAETRHDWMGKSWALSADPTTISEVCEATTKQAVAFELREVGLYEQEKLVRSALWRAPKSYLSLLRRPSSLRTSTLVCFLKLGPCLASRITPSK